MEYRIGKELDGILLKSFLLRTLRLSQAILTELKKRPDGLLVNGSHVTVRYPLRAGDLLEVNWEDEESTESVVPVRMPLTILYEDRDVIAVNKPPFMPTHPSHGHHEDTLANALAYEFARRGEPFVFRPGGRLDRDTSGAVIVAKNKIAAYRFYSCHLAGGIRKEYLAVLSGHLTPAEGTITGKIRRSADSVIMRVACEEDDADGAPALTRYRVLSYGTGEDGSPLTLVSANPVTGRTHQLRVHFASMGTPILGDFLYGNGVGTENGYGKAPWITRQALHAAKIAFPQPVTGAPVTLCADLPEDMRRLLRFFPDFGGFDGIQTSFCEEGSR